MISFNSNKLLKSWSENEVYHRNIWHEQSTYRKAITEADRQLGRFVQYLKDKDKWEHTVLLITSDHGQANEGWHEPYSPPSSVTPLLVVGAGVKKGATFEYCEIIDIAPTIADLSKKKKPALFVPKTFLRLMEGSWLKQAAAIYSMRLVSKSGFQKTKPAQCAEAK